MEIPPTHAPIAHRLPIRVAFTRTAALVTMGIGLGVVATLPESGGSPRTTLLAAVLGTAGAVTVYALPGRPLAMAVADGLLAVAVLASAFGRPGILYLPALLAFVAVTARSDRVQAQSGWRRPGLGATLAEAAGLEEESTGPLRFEAEEVEGAAVARPAEPAPSDPPRRFAEPGRHRAPSAVHRAARVAGEARRALATTARAGLTLVRTGLTPEAAPDVPTPAPGPAAVPEVGQAGGSRHRRTDRGPARGVDGELDLGGHVEVDVEDEVEAFWLAQVASGTSWTPHESYRQLTVLPYDAGSSGASEEPAPRGRNAREPG